MKKTIFDYAGAFAVGLALALFVRSVASAPPKLDYVAPACYSHPYGWNVVGTIQVDGTLPFVKHVSVLVAAGSTLQYLRTNDLGDWIVTVPADKYGVARVQVLEVLVPSKDGQMVVASGPMPSVTCRPDAGDGDDQ